MSDLPTVQTTLKLSKETDDVLLLAATVASQLLHKEPVTQVLSEDLPAFVKAMEGADLIPAEFDADPEAFCTTIGARFGQLVGAVIKAKRAAATVTK
jgi:hypothetical protein